MKATVDPYVVQQASYRASFLVATSGFRSHDWEDLRQDMVFDLLRRISKFDPARGDWRGFVRGVVRNHASVLFVRHRLHSQREVLAGDIENAVDDNNDGEVFDQFAQAGHTRLDLQIDVQRILLGLPPPLRTVASMIGETPVIDICLRMRRSRSWVHQTKRQIREAFERAGFVPRRELKNDAVARGRQSGNGHIQRGTASDRGDASPASGVV